MYDIYAAERNAVQFKEAAKTMSSFKKKFFKNGITVLISIYRFLSLISVLLNNISYTCDT